MSELNDKEMELSRQFEEFFNQRYKKEVNQLAAHYPNDKQSLIIEFQDLFTYNPDLAEDYLTYPERANKAAEAALPHVDIAIDMDISGANVRLTDSNTFNGEIKVADLRSGDIGAFHNVNGIMDKVTQSKPRVKTAAFECQKCGAVTKVPQTRHEFQNPYQCESCERDGPFRLITSDSEFVDVRKLKLKQPPEESVNGQGEDITVFVEDDLVDAGLGKPFPAHVGERVTVHGILKLNEQELHKQNADTEADIWLEARSITFEDSGIADIDLDEWEDELAELQQQDNLIEKFKQSIGPTILADEELEAAKEALVAYLFNGYRIEQEEGSYRGDLHMGLIGDPGRGKSALLNDVADIAPKVEFRSATGFSGSGVPLTAAAVQEEFAGKSEWTLQPGVLPRANGGHCIIDEIDAAVDSNTKKLHDAIEGEQILKVDKAGIKADLYTRTPLLVSGNPKNGRFDKYESIPEQVDLDPALVSRLDILLGVQDIPDPDFDEDVADHILDAWDDLSRQEVAQKANKSIDSDSKSVTREVPKDLFRAAVYHARENIHPVLTPEAKDLLGGFYVDTRDMNDSDAVPITARKLLAGIRIATAFARAEFSETVEADHAERAIKLSKRVIGLNLDMDTGELDVDKQLTGETKSQKDRRRIVMELVDELNAEDEATEETVIEKLKDGGYQESTINHDIRKLKQQGELYEPETGMLRTT